MQALPATIKKVWYILVGMGLAFPSTVDLVHFKLLDEDL